MSGRIKQNILKFSPDRINEYEQWIKQGKPKKFAVYLLHDDTIGVQVKKIGCSTKIWGRVFNGLNHKYFYNFKLLDIKYFPTKQEMLKYEHLVQKFYEKSKVTVNTYAYNKRSDLNSTEVPKTIEPILANGGSENFKEELLPNSFEEIEREMLKENFQKKENEILIAKN